MLGSNVIYQLQWDSVTVTVEFTFDEVQLDKIFDLLNLDKSPLQENNVADADFQLFKRGSTFALKDISSGEEYSFLTLNNLLVNTVNQIACCFLVRSTRLMLHGGAIIVNNKAVIFSGLSYAGKTTLTLNAWLANYPVISDDILVCNPINHTVSVFPKPLRCRLDALDIPENILNHAGSDNVLPGKFLYDMGLFVGKKSPNMIAYHVPIEINSFYYIDRGEKTVLKKINRMQALAIAFTQVYPNQQCLKISELVNYLLSKNSMYHLTIGNNEYQQALEIIYG